ncbi:hypothetical protein GW17_00026531, partial [Ensete ventricosum]
LLTPPDTPLFPSLDDVEPRPVNVSRGRAKSQPISISRTSLRSSASPRRSSPSPGSSYNIAHSRTRPSSAPRSSPPHVLRPTTPSRRPSTPPAKPSSPAQRSLTPTLRRMSTGSSGQAFAGKRGTSPIKVNRGSSASPKLRGWQSSLHDFSTDAPPNLRTSPTDRPASHVRGSSPAFGNGRTCVSKFGRQSISPSSSRSARSSHNSEGDHFTSICKPSAASSCEDDVESHASMGVSPNAATRKYRDFANTRTMGFSKKLSRSPSSCSAPKRSFDSALRQMVRCHSFLAFICCSDHIFVMFSANIALPCCISSMYDLPILNFFFRGLLLALELQQYFKFQSCCNQPARIHLNILIYLYQLLKYNLFLIILMLFVVL